jgi:hypothetical protein
VLMFGAYLTWEEEEYQHRNTIQENVAICERLMPKIQIALNSDCVHIEPTELKELRTPGPLSKWVQFEISCATEVQLLDCKPWLKSIKPIKECGLGEEVIKEPMRCVWSHYSLEKGLEETAPVTVHPNVPLRANLFVAYESENILFLTTVPHKARLDEAIQLRGSYRVEVVVTAQDAPSTSAVFIFNWNGFADMTLSPE